MDDSVSIGGAEIFIPSTMCVQKGIWFLSTLNVPTGTKDSLTRIVDTCHSQYNVRTITYQKRPPRVHLVFLSLPRGTKDSLSCIAGRYISSHQIDRSRQRAAGIESPRSEMRRLGRIQLTYKERL
jgi:hypothetical protein